MSDERLKKLKRSDGPPVGAAPEPEVQVVRRGGPVVVSPRSVVVPTARVSPHPAASRSAPAPALSTARAPPSLESVAALARRERVPMRIAKGELDGKMRCRVWRKLHAEEAKRFDDAYTLIDVHPGLSLAEAFGLLQSGLTIEDFQARRQRAAQREAVKEARKITNGEPVGQIFRSWVEKKTELSVVLGERTMVDVLELEQPVALKLARSGRLEKLKIVLIAARTVWEAMGPAERDPRLVQKPVSVPREPERRVFSDPKVFQAATGQRIQLVLRNGIILHQVLAAVGPFDLLMRSTDPADTLIVPLHALVRWELLEG